MPAHEASHHRWCIPTAIAGVAFAVLASVPAPAGSVEAAIEVRYAHDPEVEGQQHMQVVGTDSAEGVEMSPSDAPEVDGNNLWVSANRPLALIDETGTCERQSEKVVGCPNTLASLRVSLGAGADYLYYFNRQPVRRITFRTGAGPDTVEGGVADVDRSLIEIHTGPGNDRQRDVSEGLNQHTSFWGGRGDDVSEGATYARGHTGDDILRSWRDGEPGRLVGGPGADRLVSYGLDDVLRGGRGPDRIRDRGGDDVIYGGRGRDSVNTDDGGHDDINCGSGTDRVNRDWRDFLFRCEITDRLG